jgi:hypothetical protein
MSQATQTVLMIRPANFRNNEQTAVNNFFQSDSDVKVIDLNTKAQKEFDQLKDKLVAAGVRVITVEDTTDTDTPDAVFPNNWISFHENGDVAMYPMFAENRRLERREDILDVLEDEGFEVQNIMDYSSAEEDGYFLEGTGSMVLDRVNKKAYAALSPRTDEELFIEFCEDFEYTPVIFEAFQTADKERVAVYHTNVMMCIATNFAVVCLDAIDDKKERKMVSDNLKEDGKEIVAITEKQMQAFAGNMLELIGTNDTKIVVMSTTAHKSLNAKQIAQIENHATIIHSDLSAIETNGGGSARCMIAEVFLPRV